MSTAFKYTLCPDWPPTTRNNGMKWYNNDISVLTNCILDACSILQGTAPARSTKCSQLVTGCTSCCSNTRCWPIDPEHDGMGWGGSEEGSEVGDLSWGVDRRLGDAGHRNKWNPYPTSKLHACTPRTCNEPAKDYRYTSKAAQDS